MAEQKLLSLINPTLRIIRKVKRVPKSRKPGWGCFDPVVLYEFF